MLIATFKTLII